MKVKRNGIEERQKREATTKTIINLCYVKSINK